MTNMSVIIFHGCCQTCHRQIVCIPVKSIVSKFSNGKVEDLSVSKLVETSKLEATKADEQQPTESGDGQTANEKPEV